MDLKIFNNFGKNISNVQFLGGGRTLHMKGEGMFVVLLRDLVFLFQSLVSFRVFWGKHHVAHIYEAVKFLFKGVQSWLNGLKSLV